MATKTPNYQLNKPEQTDFYDIDILNANMDIIDTTLAGKVDEQTGMGLSANDYSNTDKAKVENLPENTIAELANKADGTVLQTHTQNFSNPHNVRLEQAGGSNANLLDNWDFRNPVNQRGKTKYAGFVNGGKYCIDRWIMIDYNANENNGLELIAGKGIKMKFGTSNSCRIIQAIDSPLIDCLCGKKVTFSVNVTESTTSLLIYFIINGTNVKIGDVSNGKTGIYSVCYTLPQDLTSLSVFIQNGTSSTGNYSFVQGVKLELGEDSTLKNDAPANYAEQLAICQRYYQIFTSQSMRPTSGIDHRPCMRTQNPTQGTIEIDSVTYYFSSSEMSVVSQ